MNCSFQGNLQDSLYDIFQQSTKYSSNIAVSIRITPQLLDLHLDNALQGTWK